MIKKYRCENATCAWYGIKRELCTSASPANMTLQGCCKCERAKTGLMERNRGICVASFSSSANGMRLHTLLCVRVGKASPRIFRRGSLRSETQRDGLKDPRRSWLSGPEFEPAA